MNISAARAISASAQQATEHFDILIVGAGISGIGSAYQLTKQLPDTSFVILEGQESFGGTWLTHRYPGIRSDSDLHTFGYRFKPWVGPPIATSEEIKSYMGEVIADNDLARHIRYKHRIERASWSNATSLWTIEAVRTDSGESATFTANFLWMCQGYYRHSEGYTPEWKDMDAFKGRIVHPQLWPGKLLDFADTVTYRGMMFTGVPNMAWVFGYFRASWTLRTDLVADFVIRLLAHMKQKGANKVTPALRPEDHNMPLLSWIDPENFNPGYMMRNMHLLPRRGDKPEWQHNQDYWAEKDQFPAIDLRDRAFVYE